MLASAMDRAGDRRRPVDDRADAGDLRRHRVPDRVRSRARVGEDRVLADRREPGVVAEQDAGPAVEGDDVVGQRVEVDARRRSLRSAWDRPGYAAAFGLDFFGSGPFGSGASADSSVPTRFWSISSSSPSSTIPHSVLPETRLPPIPSAQLAPDLDEPRAFVRPRCRRSSAALRSRRGRCRRSFRRPARGSRFEPDAEVEFADRQAVDVRGGVVADPNAPGPALEFGFAPVEVDDGRAFPSGGGRRVERDSTLRVRGSGDPGFDRPGNVEA